MAFYFARIWLTDSAAKLVLIAAVSVAKISAANSYLYNYYLMFQLEQQGWCETWLKIWTANTVAAEPPVRNSKSH